MISFESLAKQLGDSNVLEQLGNAIGAKPEQVEKAEALALPTLMEALNRNTNSKKGAEALSEALEQHVGEDVDDVAKYLKNVDTKDGEKILGHVFGDKSDQVAKGIAKKSGLDVKQIGGLLVQFAPLILSFLGNKKKEENLDSDGVSGLTGALSGLFGGGSGGSSGGSTGGNLLSMAGSLLDGKDDGDGGGGLLGSLGGLFK